MAFSKRFVCMHTITAPPKAVGPHQLDFRYECLVILRSFVRRKLRAACRGLQKSSKKTKIRSQPQFQRRCQGGSRVGVEANTSHEKDPGLRGKSARRLFCLVGMVAVHLTITRFRPRTTALQRGTKLHAHMIWKNQNVFVAARCPTRCFFRIVTTGPHSTRDSSGTLSSVGLSILPQIECLGISRRKSEPFLG